MNRKHSRGLSLVELMIALVLSLTGCGAGVGVATGAGGVGRALSWPQPASRVQKIVLSAWLTEAA